MGMVRKSTAELVDQYNRLSPTKLRTWKGKRSVLEDRIKHLEKERKKERDFARSIAPRKVLGKPKGKNIQKYNEGASTIKDYSIELLCQVHYYEDRTKPPSDGNRISPNNPNAVSVGYRYIEILKQVRERWPEAETTVACLRWYVVQIKEGANGYQGFRLPWRRPRPKAGGF